MMNDSLIEMIKTHEDVRSKPYRCTAGKLTIGVGRNIEDNGLSDDEIDYLLMNDIKNTIAELEKYWWYAFLSRIQQYALIDMHFNLGSTRFAGFKKMIQALESGDYDSAANEMLDSKWARQVGDRAETLAHMMRTGFGAMSK